MESLPEQRENETARKPSRSWIRRLLMLAMVMVALAICFEVARYKERERRHQADIGLLHQIDAMRKQQVADILQNVTSFQQDGKVAEAAKQLKRAKVLDFEGDFSMKFNGLIQVQTKMEAEQRQHTEKKRIDEKLAQWEPILQRRNVAEADLALKNLQEMGVKEEVLVKMREQIAQLRQDIEHERKQRDTKEAVKKKAVAVWMEKLRAADTGKYHPEAMDLLSRAMKEFPNEAELLALAEKWQKYQRTLRVPGDCASIDEALPQLRDGDVLELGVGVHYATVVVEKRITIVGAGMGKTVLEASMKEGACLRFSKAAGGSKLSQVSVRGVAYLQDKKRNPLLQVECDVVMESVEVTRSAGHGVAVLAGSVDMNACLVHGNGWDGVSAVGENSQLVIRNCRIYLNMHHGVDFWNGAVGTVFRSEIAENVLCGVLVTGGKTRVTLSQLKVRANRESGVLIDRGARVNLSHLISQVNGHSGVAVQGAGTHVVAEAVVSSTNEEYGYVISPKSRCEGLAEDLDRSGVDNKLGLRLDKGN